MARLTPAGAVDTAFGSGGVATIPTVGSATGRTVAVGTDGTIVAEAQEGPGPEMKLLLTRLTPGGALDSSFAGGSAVVVPMNYGAGMIVQDDGAIVLAGTRGGAGPSGYPTDTELLARYTAAGAPDPGFGSAGFVVLGPHAGLGQVLALPGHVVLVIGRGSSRRSVNLVTAAGAIADIGTIDPQFGGGTASYVANARPTRLSPFLQNSFSAFGAVVVRADGSYLVPAPWRSANPTARAQGSRRAAWPRPC